MWYSSITALAMQKSCFSLSLCGFFFSSSKPCNCSLTFYSLFVFNRDAWNVIQNERKTLISFGRIEMQRAGGFQKRKCDAILTIIYAFCMCEHWSLNQLAVADNIDESTRQKSNITTYRTNLNNKTFFCFQSSSVCFSLSLFVCHFIFLEDFTRTIFRMDEMRKRTKLTFNFSYFNYSTTGTDWYIHFLTNQKWISLQCRIDFNEVAFSMELNFHLWSQNSLQTSFLCHWMALMTTGYLLLYPLLHFQTISNIFQNAR